MKRIMKSKTGKLSTGMLNTAILSIVLLVVLFQLYSELIPEAQTAGNSLNTSLGGSNLGNLFTGTGIVFTIIMAALVIVVIQSFMPGKK